MKNLLLIPISVIITAALVIVASRVVGFTLHTQELFIAAVIGLLAGELGIVPMILTRGASQYAVTQAALVASIVHLFSCTAFGGILIATKPITLDPSFIYLLMLFYFLTLILLVNVLVRAVRTAPVEATPVNKQA